MPAHRLAWRWVMVQILVPVAGVVTFNLGDIEALAAVLMLTVAAAAMGWLVRGGSER
jgi:hypothetical protein